MILLTQPTDLLQIVTSTGSIDFYAAFVDSSTTAVTPDRSSALITTGTTTNAVDSPGPSTQRSIKFMSAQAISGSSANTVSFQYNDGGGTIATLWNGILNSQESVIYDGTSFQKYNSVGIAITAGSTANVDVQDFGTAGTFTWTKPTSFTPSTARVFVWGAGGGGGAGGSNATNAALKHGGSGGGGGAFSAEQYLISDLTATVTVTVGAGGTAGAPGAAGAVGGDGGQGGNSSFGTYATAYGGGGGRGGAITAAAGGGGGGGGTGGAGGVGSTAAGNGGLPVYNNTQLNTGVVGGQGSQGTVTVITTHNAEFGGGGGGGHTNVPANAVGGGSLRGGAGGGCGAGTTAVPAAIAGGNGGLAGAYIAGTGGAAGTNTPPTAGSAGAAGNSTVGGSGGGGGGTSTAINTAGAAGGNGGTNGGGGGGGGAGNGTAIGGAGGTGGVGRVIVFTW